MEIFTDVSTRSAAWQGIGAGKEKAPPAGFVVRPRAQLAAEGGDDGSFGETSAQISRCTRRGLVSTRRGAWFISDFQPVADDRHEASYRTNYREHGRVIDHESEVTASTERDD